MVVQFNPTILGLNTGIFWTVFEQFGTEFGLCVLFLCVIAKK